MRTQDNVTAVFHHDAAADVLITSRSGFDHTNAMFGYGSPGPYPIMLDPASSLGLNASPTRSLSRSGQVARGQEGSCAARTS